jgi:hypothetical protein
VAAYIGELEARMAAQGRPLMKVRRPDGGAASSYFALKNPRGGS